MPEAHAGVAKLVDARDLKSLGSKELCRFDPGRPHQTSHMLVGFHTLFEMIKARGGEIENKTRLAY
jgi:hypothetical protein